MAATAMAMSALSTSSVATTVAASQSSFQGLAFRVSHIPLLGVAKSRSLTVLAANNRTVRVLKGTSNFEGVVTLLQENDGRFFRSFMTQGAPLLGADKKMSLTLGHLRQKRIVNGGVRCQVLGASPSQGAAYEPDSTAPSAPDITLVQKVRALCFYLTTFVVAVPLFIVMLVLQPFVLLLDRRRRIAQHLVNKVWATLTTCLFYKTEIEGWENLPGSDEGAVYVANHQSFLDIYTLFQLGRPFKFISKTSNFLIPIIGWSMYLTGHIPLKRMDKRSQLECLKTCLKLVKEGVSVLFFPEGTRTTDGAMAAFKKGAFTVAAKGGVPVVPITIIGSGKLMPNGLEYTLRPGVIKMIVHPPLRSTSADQLCDQSRKVLAETLVKHGLPVH